MNRILLAGLLGGLVVFLWGAFSHIVLPIGQAGIRVLPNEAPVLEAVRAGVPRSGLYFFPGLDRTPGMTAEQKAAAERDWSERYRRGPNGILVLQAGGGEPFSVRQLILELVTNILGAAIAAMLLTLAATSLPSFGARVLFVTLLGVFASVAIDLSYWNWYGFPPEYTAAALLDQTVSWLLGGLVLARIIQPPL